MFAEKYLKCQNAPVPLIFIFCLFYYSYLFFFVIFDNIIFCSKINIYNNNISSKSVSRWMDWSEAELPTLY